MLVLKLSSFFRACISAGSVFHVVGAIVRNLFYPKEIWLDYGISRSKSFLYWCCELLSVIRSFMSRGERLILQHLSTPIRACFT